MLLLANVYHSIGKQIRTVPCSELLVSALSSFDCCVFPCSSGWPYLVVTPCSPGCSGTLGEFLVSAAAWTVQSTAGILSIAESASRLCK